MKASSEAFGRPVVADRTKEGPSEIIGVPGCGQIRLDQALRERMEWYEADLIAFAEDPKVGDAFPELDVAHGEPAKLLAADPVIEERCEDGSIPLAFERVLGRRREQCAGLVIRERRRHAFARARARPLHAVYRVVGDRVAFAQEIEQRGQGRELAADGRGRELARLEVLAVGDHVCPSYGPQLLGRRDPQKHVEVADVSLVGTAGLGVGEVREPLELGRHVGEALELGSGQGAARRRRGRQVSGRWVVSHGLQDSVLLSAIKYIIALSPEASAIALCLQPILAETATELGPTDQYRCAPRSHLVR